MEKLLSVAEAAEKLDVHRTRINQLIESGDLPATRIGRAYVIREADLELVRERPAPGRPAKPTGEEKATRTGPTKEAGSKKPAAKKAAKKGRGK